MDLFCSCVRGGPDWLPPQSYFFLPTCTPLSSAPDLVFWGSGKVGGGGVRVPPEPPPTSVFIDRAAANQSERAPVMPFYGRGAAFCRSYSLLELPSSLCSLLLLSLLLLSPAAWSRGDEKPL